MLRSIVIEQTNSKLVVTDNFKMPKTSIKIEIEELKEVGPENISAEELKDLIVSSSNAVKIIDLRTVEEYKQGHITKSVNIPFTDLQPQQLIAEVHSAGQKSTLFSLVFVSLQSPDIDDYAARQCIALYQQTYNALPPTNSMRILFGGFSNWTALFGTDSTLTA